MSSSSIRFDNFLDRESSLGVLLMLPGLSILAVFLAYPFALGIWLSLTDTRIGMPGEYIGLWNYIDLLEDDIFHQTAWNTMIYALVTVPFKAILGLGLALVLNNRIRFSNPIRAFIMLPWIVPTALSSLGWFMIFDPVFSPLSWLMIQMGLIESNINFLGDQVLAVTAICWVNIWRGIPFFGISILAGLQAVPEELHEQAAIDGAKPVSSIYECDFSPYQGDRYDHQSAFHHLDFCRFSVDLHSYQRRACQPDSYLWNLCIPSRDVCNRNWHGCSDHFIHVPNPRFL